MRNVLIHRSTVGPRARMALLLGALLSALTIAAWFAAPARAAGIIVTSPLDTQVAGDGACTLREAIVNANSDGDSTAGDCAAGSGPDLISFAIAIGPQTITLTGALPTISGPLTINGASQPGYLGAPLISLYANNLGSTILTVQSSGVGINDLIISGAPATALRLSNADGASISRVNVAWGGAAQSGTGVLIDSGSDGVTLSEVTATRRREGISVGGGSDLQILDSDLTGSGADTDNWALDVTGLTAGTIPGGLRVSGTSFGNSTTGVRLQNMSGLLIADNLFPGVTVDLSDNGAQTLTSITSYPLWLHNVDNSTVANLDLSWSLTTSRTGFGLRLNDLSDTITVQNIKANNRQTGVYAFRGSDLRVLDSDMSHAGTDNSNPALYLHTIGTASLPGGVLVAGNTYTNSFGIRINSMPNLIISDGSVAGTNIDLTDGAGNHTLTRATGTALYLNNTDNLLVQGVDLSYTGGSSRTGTGLFIENGSDTLTIRDSQIRNRLAGVVINGGSDVQVRDNDLSGSGNDAGNPALYLSGVGKSALPDGVLVAGNTFSNAGFGIRILNIPNLTISDGSVAGTDIDVTDGAGNHTLTSVATYPLSLYNADNVTIANLDLSWANSVGGARSGTGLYLETGNDTVTIRDSQLRNRTMGIYAGGGSDVQVRDNDLSGSGNDPGNPALYLSGVGKSALPDGVAVSGNTFSNAGFGIRILNIPNLTISDGSVAGTDIDVTDGAGNQTLTSVATYPLWLYNADNVTIANLDLSWANSLGGARSGTGLYLENANDTVTIRDSQLRNRSMGIYAGGGSDVQVRDNDLSNSGQNSGSPALYLSGVGKSALPDGVLVAGNSFSNASAGIRINNIPNLTISDGSVAGTDIDVTDGAGNHTLSSIADYPLWLYNADNVTIANLDLSWANSLGGARSGTGLYLETGNDTVTIRDSQLRNRTIGIYAGGGSDVQVRDNDLSNSGSDNSSPALYLNAISKIALPDGVAVSGNTFSNAGFGIRINNIPNLTISDGSVAGTDIDLTDGAGNHTLTSVATYPLWLYNADNLTIANVDLSWANSLSGARSGTGLYLETGNDNVTIRDSQFRNRLIGISANAGSDLRVLDNHLGNSGQDTTSGALVLNSITAGALPGGVLVAGNNFTDAGTGLILTNMANLVISDGSLVGTNIDLTDGAGNHTLTTVSNYPIFFRHNVDNTTVSRLDLSWAHRQIAGRSGTGLWVSSQSGNSNSGLVVSDLVVTGRNIGASITYAPGATVGCSVFADNNQGLSSINIAPDTNPSLTNNLFQGNSTGVAWNVASPALSASNNYWGAASGPSNLGGSGDSYTNAVSASPFLTSPAGCTTLPVIPPPPIVSDPAASFIVTTNSDVSDGATSSIAALVADPGADGAISLREAITAANNTPGADTIGFAIGSGPQTIYLSAVLPTISDQLTIDGTSQPITIDAQGLSGTIITLQAAGSILRDFTIINAAGTALQLSNADNVELRNLDLSWGSVGVRRGTGLSVGSGSDNLLVDNLTANRRSNGITVSGGSGLQLRNSTLNDNATALFISGVSASGLSIEANSYAGSNYGLRIAGSSGLVISDGSVLGTNIDLRDSLGNQTLTTVSSYALYLENVDDSSVQNVNLGWAGAPTGRSGNGLYVTTASDRLLVQNIVATRRSYGVYISGGVDQQVRDSNLGDNGQALYMENITAGSLPGGVSVAGNSYAGSSEGVHLSNLRDQVISDGSVAGTTVDLRDSLGNQTMGSVSTRALRLSNTDDSSVQNVNLGWNGAPTGRSGIGLQADNASDRLLVQNIVATRRGTGVYISGGADQQVRDSNLGDNAQALFLQSITAGSLPGGVSIAGNSYAGSSEGVHLSNLRDQVISDGSVAGTTIDLRDSLGNQTMGSVSSRALWLSNTDDSSVQNVNLGWNGAPTGRSGYGIYADSGSDRLLVQNIVATRRGYGIYISGGADQQVRDSNLGDNSQALYMESITAGSLPGGVGIAGNSYAGSSEAVRFVAMRNLVISDGSVAGTNVDLRDSLGNQTMGSVSTRALYLSNVDDSLVQNVNLGWTSSSSPSGYGIYTDSGTDRLQIRGIAVERRVYALWLQNGIDVQVHDSNLRNANYNLWLQDITPGSLPGGAAVSGNDYTNSEFSASRSISLINMRDQVISDGTAAGTTMDLRNGSGAQTVGNAATALFLQNVDSSVVDGIDVSWSGSSRSGTGVDANSGNDNTIIRNITAGNRSYGINAASSTNLDALDNDLSNSSVGLNMSGVSAADIAGNDFTNNNQAIRLTSMSGVSLTSGVGLTTVSGTVIELNNVSNSTLSDLDLTYSGPIRQGTGVYIYGASSTNISISGSRFVNRSAGVSFANNNTTFSLSCNYFLNNGTGVQAGALNSNQGPTALTLSNNRFQLNGVAINNPNRLSGGTWTAPAPVVTAESNYWGALSGPAALGGSGDTYSGNVDADPFSPFAAGCVNTPPAIDPGGPYAVDEGGSLGLNASATSDVDQAGNTLTYQWDLDADAVLGETGAAATRGEELGPVTIFSAAGLDGDAVNNVDLAVIDDSNVPATVSVPVLVLNVPPSFEAGPNAIAYFGVFTREAIAFSDPGTPDLHTVDIDWGDGNLETLNLVAGVRSFELSHTYAAPGVYPVQLTLSDDDGGQAIDSFSVEAIFNSPPTISSLSDLATDEDVAPGPIAFTVDDAQTPVADLVVSAESSNTALVPNTNLALGGSAGSRSLTITPAPDLNGTSTITVTVSDGTLSASASFTLTVNPVNDAPTLDALGDQTIGEDAGPQTVSLAGIADGDPELSQTLTITATSSNPALIAAPTVSYSSPDASGALDFAPAADASGSATITVRVTDDGSSTAPNVNFVERSFTVTVSAVNDDPSGLSLDNSSVAENEPIGALVGSFSPTDIDGGAGFSYSLVSGLGDADNGSFDIVGDELRTAAVFDYESRTSYSIRVEVSDGSGGTFAAVFSIDITDVAIAPTITSPPPGDGQYGQAYSHSFSASGEPDATFGVTAGSLPPGLILSPAGLLSGTPTQAGTFGGIAISAENGVAPAAAQTFTIVIAPAALSVTADPQTRTYGDANPALSFAASGFVNGDSVATALTGGLATVATTGSPVGSYPITQGTLAAANYTISYSGAALTVTPAALTITADAQSRAYGDANPALTFVASGLLNGDTVATALTGGLSTSATIVSPVGTYPITQGDLAAANYTISYSGADLTVTPAALTITADDKARAFGEPNPALTFVATGFVNGETSAILTGGLATAATSASPVGSYPITLGDLAAPNYSISFTPGTLTIAGALLTVVADPQTRTYGDANPALTYTVSGFVNGDTAAILTGGLATVATGGSPVGSYAITQGDLTAPNYSISYTGADLTISPAALSVTADPQSRSYGDANPALTYTVGGLVNGDSVATALTGSLATTATAASSVGSYPISQGSLVAANYSISYSGANLEVTPAPLSITAYAQTRSYGDPNPALTFVATGFVNGDIVAGALTGGLSTSATIVSPVGAYPITQGDLAAANYTISYSGADLTITPAALTITADDKARAFGEPNPALTFVATGLVNGETPATAMTGGLATSATAASPVGSYPITQGDLAAPNYSISFTPGTLTIASSVLTVVADSQSRDYGDANPALTYSVSGFVNGDTAAIMTGGLATVATTGSPVGSYAITQGTLSAPNYSITYTGANLEVTPAPLSITVDAQTRTYGVANPALTFVASGLLNGDTVATALTGGLSTSATIVSPVGAYPITQGDLAAANYTLSYSGAALTVTPTALTITADDKARAFGEPNPALTFVATGFVNGETSAILTGGLATSATAASPVGSYPITQGDLAAPNYSISFTPGTLTIASAVLTVVADNQSRGYGDANPALTYSVSGFVNGDTAAIMTGGLATVATSGSPVGSYAITLGDLAAPNYSISFTGASLTVSPAALSVTADAQSRDYGAANPALSFVATGFVNGDSVATALTGGLATVATSASPVGAYPISQGDLAAANYTISYSGAALTVTPTALTITADDKARAFGEPNPALTFVATGFVNGETTAIMSGALSTTATIASPVGSYPITQGDLAAPNYSISFTPGTLTIASSVLTVVADSQSRDYGDPNPALTYTVSGFVNGDTAAIMTGGLATAATAGSPVGSYPITLGDLTAPNYAISYTGASLAVAPAPLTVTADAQSRSYGDANPALTFVASGFVNGETTAIITGGLATAATISSPVGSYAISQGDLAAPNYAISYTGASLAVTPAPLTVTADAQGRTYGEPNPALSFVATGFVNGETVASALTGGLATTATPASPVGAYPITLGDLAAANYTISYSGADLTVTPAALAVVADDKAKAFGEPNPALTFVATGFVNGDTVASALTGGLATTATPASPVGAYPITLGDLAAANYSISFTPGTLTIANAVLSVAADSQSRDYGAANPALTYTVSGFVNGDTAAIMTGGLETSATAASPVGSYPIGQGTLAAPNYAISFTGASLAVTPAPLTVTADNQSRLFGAANPPLTISYSGFVNGEDIGALDVQPSASTVAVPTSPVGSYPISVGGGSAGNYSLTYVSGTLSILPTGTQPCSASSLRSLLSGPGPLIELDGACRYLISDQSGTNGHGINLYGRQNLIIEGHGAVIERADSAGQIGLLALIDSTNVTIRNLTLMGGQANGSSAQLSGRGGGMVLYNSTGVALIGVRFINNQATLGGALALYGGDTSILNGVFADNRAGASGAALFAQGRASITNSTFSSTSRNPGEAIFTWDDLTLQNSIVANHAVALAAADSSSQVREDYNLYAGVGQARKPYNPGTRIAAGAGSFTTPDSAGLFVAPAGHDYQLRGGAAAIDRGADLGGALDGDGRARPFGNSYVDMGAYEFQGDGSLQIRKLGPLWVDNGVTFTYQLSVANLGRAGLSDLEVRDTLPAGASYVGGASAGGAFDGQTMRWTIASLAAGEVRSFSYQLNASQNLRSDAYEVVGLSDPALWATGPAFETQLNPAVIRTLHNSAGQSFDPTLHGFDFTSWRDSAAGPELDAASMYTLYGAGVCTTQTGASAQSCVLTAVAAEQLKQLQLSNSAGRSFGTIAASMQLFVGQLTPGELQPGAAFASDLLQYPALSQLIGLYQAGRASQSEARVTDGTPGALVDFLLANDFDGPNDDGAYTLSIRQPDGGGTKALLPYALEQQPGGIYWLYVYDSSAPGERDRIIVIDPAAQTWTYTDGGAPVGAYAGDAGSGSIFMRDLAADTDLPRQCDFCAGSGGQTISFALNGPGGLLITDSAGRRAGIDPLTGELINEIPGATVEPRESEGDSPLPPSIRLPLGDSYRPSVFGLGGTPVGLTISAPDMLAELSGLRMSDPADPDALLELSVDYERRAIGFTAGAEDTSGVTMVLALGTPDGTSYRFALGGVDLPAGETVEMSFDPATSQLSISDSDLSGTQQYNLTITQVQPDGDTLTQQRNDVTSGGGIGALIDLGGWDGQSWPETSVVPSSIFLPLIIR